MRLVYGNKEIELTECNSFWSRFRGFMLVKNIDRALLFRNCNSIHTFFMRDNIDVIMCDGDGNVLFFWRDFGRGRVILPKRGVKYTLETPKNFFDIKINTKIDFF